MKKQTIGSLISACLVLAAGVVTVQADTYNWDPARTGSTSGGSGGSGTWNLTTANWYDSSVGSEFAWNNSGTNTAVFGGAAGGTVTLGTSLVGTNLQFTTAGYTLAGTGPLTLWGGLDASALSSGTATVSVPVTVQGHN